ncbi:PUA-like domain-containing protein [Dichomitus squalens]|uniref:PUA-like domain-containing protein n=1 Tax=Dichomitus squalens TaxID=114155 RepID=A0A4Q9MR67_9APHY|nr:PUA-like domain-containing protein [Dichomitus squalens]
MAPKHWLMKAEPDSRVVKGKDVKFSVDDFEAVKTTPWEGVRNAEARNLMKEMKVGDKVLFYHSNCKNPGIAAFAEVTKEAHPDYTAWDPSHPYYDAKTDKENPKWYMVEVTFGSRAKHFVPLSLLRNIASSSEPPEEVAYIGQDGAKAIKGMALVTRGRLSVQRVEEDTWEIIEQLAERGGWEETGTSKPKTKSQPKGKAKSSGSKQARGRKKAIEHENEENGGSESDAEQLDAGEAVDEKKLSRRKRKAPEDADEDFKPRRSARVRR